MFSPVALRCLRAAGPLHVDELVEQMSADASFRAYAEAWRKTNPKLEISFAVQPEACRSKDLDNLDNPLITINSLHTALAKRALFKHLSQSHTTALRVIAKREEEREDEPAAVTSKAAAAAKAASSHFLDAALDQGPGVWRQLRH